MTFFCKTKIISYLIIQFLFLQHANSVDDDAEWEKFQKGLTKREKALEGKSRMSHAVHCPYFPDDKQEYWWTYVCDRKKHMLITAPYQVGAIENFYLHARTGGTYLHH